MLGPVAPTVVYSNANLKYLIDQLSGQSAGYRYAKKYKMMSFLTDD
jgi:hypothetical protein